MSIFENQKGLSLDIFKKYPLFEVFSCPRWRKFLDILYAESLFSYLLRKQIISPYFWTQTQVGIALLISGLFIWCISTSCLTWLVSLAQQSYSWFVQTISDSMFFHGFFPSFFHPTVFLTWMKTQDFTTREIPWVRLETLLYSRRADSALPKEKHEVLPCQIR